jgi:putative ABC transport system permease protein
MFRLLLRNLLFHWRGNLAILLGAAVGAAVLAGALLVGDSLRGSLRDRVERQLGWVTHALIGGRFFREEVAKQIDAPEVSGAILLQGAVRTVDGESGRQAGKVTILGVADDHWMNEAALKSDQPVAVLSHTLAEALGVKAGDRVYVNVQRASNFPRSSVLGRRSTEDATSRLELTVIRVLAPDDPANDFSLSPSPTTPLNLWLPLHYLQSRRALDQPGRINAIFIRDDDARRRDSRETVLTRFREAQWGLGSALTLDDWGLSVEIHGHGEDRYISLESRQLLLEPTAADAAKETAAELHLEVAPTLVYLVNRITPGDVATPPANVTGAVAGGFTRLMEIPYSVVAAVDPAAPRRLNPLRSLREGEAIGPIHRPDIPRPGAAHPSPAPLLDNTEIALVDWSAPTLLGGWLDEPITLTYFKPEIEGRIETGKVTLSLRGYIPLKGPADDPNLTPKFPGITDKLTLASWDPPFPYEGTWVGPRDEQFWQQHRTTPKAYVTLATGQKLWGSRFGNLTSIRMAPADSSDPEKAVEPLRAALLKHLDPEKGGFVFEPVRERLLQAGQGSTDFGMLFLAFSFFLIVAALMLVGLLFRLNLDRRADEVGLLLATGFRPRTVRRLLLAEGFILAIAGGLLGLAFASLYADLMLKLLIRLWPTEGVGSFLHLHVSPLSLVIGLVTAVLMSQLALFWAVRVLNRVPPSALLNGETTPPPDPSKPLAGSHWAGWIAAVSFVLAAGLAVMAPSLPPGEAQAGTFFGSGAMLLTAGLALVWAWLKRPRHAPVTGHGAAALARLGSRNATRNPTRSLLTAALLSSAAFLLVAVESFRREPEKDFLSKTGGSGGFPLLAESDVPVPFDPNSPEGRADLLDNLQRTFQEEARRQPPGPPMAERLRQADAFLKGITVYPFRLKAGDDASCLNLYQATRPRLLGAPDSLIERGGFRFADSEAKSTEQKENPWLLLRERRSDGAIPIFVEQNTAVWMLKKGLGDELEVPDENNQPMRLRIVGLLMDSVFQSELLLPDWAFRQHFARYEGFSYFLIDVSPDQASEASRLLSAGLQPFGLTVTPTRQRVAAYLAVQNTYLTTFQMLGGFGLVLGVLGLAVVLLRSVWERRAEFALLRAVGYRRRTLNWLVLAENTLLLVLGLGVGLVAALAAVAPHLASGQEVPFGRLAAMLGLVLVVGLGVAAAATVTTLRAPLIPALRKE